MRNDTVTRKGILATMTLKNINEPFLDLLKERAVETKPSRTARGEQGNKRNNKSKSDRNYND